MGRKGRVLSASLGAVVFMSFIWFLFVGVLVNRATKTTSTLIPSSTTNSKLLLELIATQRHAVYWDFDLNYVSKRRVPNGPDPIHNRNQSMDACMKFGVHYWRAGKARQPPGRA